MADKMPINLSFNIPLIVMRDKRLTISARVLFAEILAMSMQSGYCWALNAHLTETLGISERTIQRSLQQLKELNYITVQIPDRSSRKIYPVLPLTQAQETSETPPVKMTSPPVKMAPDPRQNDTNRYQLDTIEINTLDSYESKGAKPENYVEEFGNSQINQVIEHFEKRIGHMPRAKYQRYAASTLIKRHGFEKTIGGINAVVASRGEPFAPTISTLEALRDKWLDLETFYLRIKAKKKGLMIA